MNYFVIFGIIILSCISCGYNDPALTESLHSSGSNKDELKHVLSYYQKNSRDSLKLKAAIFLIRNMTIHYAPYGSRLDSMNQFFKIIQLLNESKSIVTKDERKRVVDSIQRYIVSNCIDNIKYISDNQVLNASYIIDNIEIAFDTWEKSSWYQEVSFSDFCEFILPYRVRREGLVYWRTNLLQEYKDLCQKEPSYLDLHTIFNHHTTHTYNSIVADNNFVSWFKYDMDFHQMDIVKAGACLERCAYATYHLRAAGIPATFDFIPSWGNRKHSLHAMVGLSTSNRQMFNLISNGNEPIDTTNKVSNAHGRALEHNFTKNELPHGLYVQYVKTVPKVYRMTWSIQNHQLELFDNVMKDEIVPQLGQLNIIDVSEQYLSCKDVVLELPEIFSNFRIAYLAVFDKNGWIPVSAYRIDSTRKLKFLKMGRNILYLPVVRKHGSLIPIGEPFILTESGDLNIIKNNQEIKGNIRLTRKYPFFLNTAHHVIEMKDSYFEGANKFDFSDSEVLANVDYYPFYMNEIFISDLKDYRYIRFCPASNMKPTIAEMKLYGLDEQDTILLEGHIISGQSSENMTTNAFDNNLETFFHSSIRNEWVGVDLGEGGQTKITSIQFCPRNDANCIIPGNEYELFFWNDKWKSLGIKTATEYDLCFDNVPSNSLYWLHCITEGNEERIFTYNQNGQTWW